MDGQDDDTRALKGDLAERRTSFAEDRTDWAEDRTALANEGTFAGWMRTAFAAIGIGIGFNALFEKLEPSWVPKSIATGFIVIGMVVMYLAQQRACSAVERLTAHAVHMPAIRKLRLLSWAVIAGGFALSAAFWLLSVPVPR